MTDPLVSLDVSAASSSLAVRQALASCIGIGGKDEVTWQNILDRVRDPDLAGLPKRLRVRGLPSLALRLPDDERMLRELVRQLVAQHPGIDVRFVLHD